MGIAPGLLKYHNSDIPHKHSLGIPMFSHYLDNIGMPVSVHKIWDMFLPVFLMDSLFRSKYPMLLKRLPVHSDIHAKSLCSRYAMAFLSQILHLIFQ